MKGFGAALLVLAVAVSSVAAVPAEKSPREVLELAARDPATHDAVWRAIVAVRAEAVGGLTARDATNATITLTNGTANSTNLADLDEDSISSIFESFLSFLGIGGSSSSTVDAASKRGLPTPAPAVAYRNPAAEPTGV